MRKDSGVRREGEALWIPFAAPPDATGGRGARWVYGVARVRERVGLARAQEELSGIAAGLARIHPESNREVGVRVEPLLRAETGEIVLHS